MIAIGVSLILFFPEVFQKNVSYLAHGLGFGIGLILGISTFFLRKKAIRSHEVWVEKPPVDTSLEEYIDALEAYELEHKKGDPKVACKECSTLQ